MRAASGLLVALLCLLTLGACSAARIGYLNADWLIARQADHYLDLDREQRDWLRDRLREQMAWHSAQELPRYRFILESIHARVDRGLAGDDVRWLLTTTRERYAVLAQRMVPDIAVLLATLTPAQIDHLEARLLERLEDAAPRSEQSRPARTIRQLERWTGRLDQRQRAEVTRLLSSFPEPEAQAVPGERRRERIETFITVLRNNAEARELEQLLTLWWVAPAMRPPEVSSLERQVAFAVAFDALLVPKQRRRVLRNIEGYHRDVAALLARVAPQEVGE